MPYIPCMVASLDIVPGLRLPYAELAFSFTRSGGPGGQNVNKVSTRVELRFDIEGSLSLDEGQKRLLRTALGSRVGRDGVLTIQVQESRSQWRNRQIAAEKLAELLRQGLRPRKKRRATNPTAGSRERRFSTKKRKGAVKHLRGRISPDD
jgi:ribosome-associated protein